MTDLPGKAIHDFYFKKSRSKLFVHDTFGPKVEMPLSLYFRGLNEMPLLEKKALDLCSGKILDIGAGAGSHALELQMRQYSVVANEISPAACEVMKARGIENVVCEDIFKFKGEKFDTLLLLMNGIGLCQNVEGFNKFLKKAGELLNENGKLIFDSCDISYMYDEFEYPENHYYGEVQCRYEYQKTFTDWFSWLYLDSQNMQNVAEKEGWECSIVYEDENDQYLAVLSKKVKIFLL